MLLADDDCRYTSESLRAVINAYTLHPKAKLITFQFCDAEGVPIKAYPKKSFSYPDVPKGFYLSSCEISLRRMPDMPMFNPHFGIGADVFGCGEEEVYLIDFCKRFPQEEKLYLPITIGQTPAYTTGQRFLCDAPVQRAKGAVLRILHTPMGAWLRIVKTACMLPVNWSKRLHIYHEMRHGMQLVKKYYDV